jgi:signal transduction histidine kinase
MPSSPCIPRTKQFSKQPNWGFCLQHPERQAHRALREVLWAIGLWLLLAPGAVHAAFLELREAHSAVTIDGVTVTGMAALPYHWDRLHEAKEGSAAFELSFPLPPQKADSYAIYFSRLGNAYQVWLNGSLLSHSGDMKHAGGADSVKAPRYFPIPSQLLQTDNTLRILIRADGGRHGGVAAPLIGPEDEVREVYASAYRFRQSASFAVSIFSWLVGMTALLLWFTQTRLDGGSGRLTRDPVYLFASVAELGWALRMGDAVIEQPPLAWPWWGILISVAYASWICSMTLFCHQVAGLQSRAANWLLGAVFASGVLASVWALLGGAPLVWTAWLGAAAIGFVIYGFYYSGLALRRPEPARVLIAIAVMTNVLAGMRDWLVVRLSGDLYGEESWIRYTSVLFGLTLGYIVITRFRAASAQAQDLMTTLSARVAQKENDLQASYQKLEALAREQARAGERTRILRDMHDGVGAHISAAIRQLQSGKASHEQLLQTLRESLDQLKLSIDAMNQPPGDITALLANLRYRLEPRLKASDIALQWDVDLIEPMAGLDDKTMRQFQFMVFEALSNVLQHAHASELRIELRRTSGGGVQLRVIDNGCGFDPQAVHPKGLGSLRERAVAIGARLQVSSAPGRTVVEIVLE